MRVCACVCNWAAKHTSGAAEVPQVLFDVQLPQNLDLFTRSPTVHHINCFHVVEISFFFSKVGFVCFFQWSPTHTHTGPGSDDLQRSTLYYKSNQDFLSFLSKYVNRLCRFPWQRFELQYSHAELHNTTQAHVDTVCCLSHPETASQWFH